MASEKKRMIYNYFRTRWESGYNFVSDAPNDQLLFFKEPNVIETRKDEDNGIMYQLSTNADRSIWMFAIVVKLSATKLQRNTVYEHLVAIQAEIVPGKPSVECIKPLFQSVYGNKIFEEVITLAEELSVLEKNVGRTQLESYYTDLESVLYIVGEHLEQEEKEDEEDNIREKNSSDKDVGGQVEDEFLAADAREEESDKKDLPGHSKIPETLPTVSKEDTAAGESMHSPSDIQEEKRGIRWQRSMWIVILVVISYLVFSIGVYVQYMNGKKEIAYLNRITEILEYQLEFCIPQNGESKHQKMGKKLGDKVDGSHSEDGATLKRESPENGQSAIEDRNLSDTGKNRQREERLDGGSKLEGHGNDITKTKRKKKLKRKEKPKLKPKPESKNEPKLRPKTESKPESKNESKTESKSESKTKSKTETKTEQKANPKPETKAKPTPETIDDNARETE